MIRSVLRIQAGDAGTFKKLKPGIRRLFIGNYHMDMIDITDFGKSNLSEFGVIHSQDTLLG